MAVCEFSEKETVKVLFIKESYKLNDKNIKWDQETKWYTDFLVKSATLRVICA